MNRLGWNYVIAISTPILLSVDKTVVLMWTKFS